MEIMNENNTVDLSSFSVLLSSSTIASSFEISLSESLRNERRLSKQKKMFVMKKLRATKKPHQMLWSTSSPCTHQTIAAKSSNKSLKKLFSFKSKLNKSKKLKMKQNAESCCASMMWNDNIYSGKQKEEFDWSFDNEQAEKKVDNQEPVIQNLLRATIFKLMDKPLGWFKQKSQKRKINKAKKNSNNETEWINANFNSQITDYESTAPANFTHLVELEGKQINLRMQSLGFMHANNSATSHILKNRSVMISAPSMSSSFDDNKKQVLHHSTPQSLCQQFSPILSKKSLDGTKSSCISSTSFVSSHSTPITSSCSRLSNIMGRRLSFGVTSSPLPFGNDSNYFDNNIYYDNEEFTDSNYESQNEFELNNGKFAINKQTSQFSINTSVLSLNNDSSEQEEQQKKLIDHIDNIKRNVRLGVKMRLNFYNGKKEASICNDQEEKKNHKSKRLQKIFRAKLRKQLKEMKKWQVKVKEDIENVKSDNDQQSMCENTHDNNSINCSSSSHNYYYFDRPNFYDCNCQLSHHQRFHSNQYEDNKNSNSFLLYENANRNYENHDNLIFRNNFYDFCH